MHLSDWHADAESFKEGFAREVREDPRFLEADVVVMSGDMVFDPLGFKSRISNPGLIGQMQKAAFDQMVDFVEVCMPGMDVVGVRGNHDYFNYGILGDSWQGLSVFNLLGRKWASVRGVPYHYGGWNDELQESELAALYKQVPDDVEVLVSHCPPFGVLDDVHDAPNDAFLASLQDPENFPMVEPRNIGSNALRDLVDRLPKLQLHMFGHVHEQGCKVEVRKNVVFSNASCGANFVVI